MTGGIRLLARSLLALALIIALTLGALWLATRADGSGEPADANLRSPLERPQATGLGLVSGTDARRAAARADRGESGVEPAAAEVPLEGWVESPEGDRAVGTGARLLWRSGSREVEVPVRDDGSWSASLPAGTWTLAAAFPGCSDEQPVRPWQLVVSESQEPVRQRLVVSDLGSIRGWVADCNSARLPQVAVAVEDRRVTTDASGEFEFDCLRRDRKYVLTVAEETIPDGLLPPWWQLRGEGYSPRTPAGVSPSEEEQVLTLSRGTVVAGVATGPDGGTLPGASLSLRRTAPLAAGELVPEPLNYVVVTDERGGFSTAPLPEGRWRAYLYGQSPPGQAVPDAVHFELACGQPERFVALEFSQGLGPHGIEGQVVNLGPGPLEGLCFAVWAARPGLLPESRPSFPAKCHGYSDAAGAFFLRGLPPGAYLLGQIDLTGPQRQVLQVPAHDLLRVELGEAAEEIQVQWVTQEVPLGEVAVVLEPGTPADRDWELTILRAFEHRSQPWSRTVTLFGGAPQVIEGVPCGILELELRGADSAPAATLSVSLSPGQRLEISCGAAGLRVL